MSHFSTIKTQLRKAEPLIKALSNLGYVINQEKTFINGFRGSKLKKTFISKLLILLTQLGKKSSIGLSVTGSGSGAAIIASINSGLCQRVVIAVKAPKEFPTNTTFPFFLMFTISSIKEAN